MTRQTGNTLEKVHTPRTGFDRRHYMTACGRRGMLAKVPADVTCKRCKSLLKSSDSALVATKSSESIPHSCPHCIGWDARQPALSARIDALLAQGLSLEVAVAQAKQEMPLPSDVQA